MASLSQEQVAAAMAAQRSLAPENSTEMRRYMEKLADLVPTCPKNGRVTKLELIEHVIHYISDLQDTLQSDSDSDSPPQSPVERMSFSDAFSLTPKLPGNSKGDYSSGYNSPGSDSCDMDYTNTNTYTNNNSNTYTTNKYNNNYSTQEFSGAASGFNGASTGFSNSFTDLSSSFSASSSSSNYSQILYSDHGSSHSMGYHH